VPIAEVTPVSAAGKIKLASRRTIMEKDRKWKEKSKTSQHQRKKTRVFAEVDRATGEVDLRIVVQGDQRGVAKDLRRVAAKISDMIDDLDDDEDAVALGWSQEVRAAGGEDE
jgi:hypothetical protein